MNPLLLLWLGIVGLIVLMFAGQIVTVGKTVLGKAWPAASTSATVTTIGTVADTASKYTQYATAHGALYTLRLIDFENVNLDISAELTAIDSKLALAMKANNTTAQ